VTSLKRASVWHPAADASRQRRPHPLGRTPRAALAAKPRGNPSGPCPWPTLERFGGRSLGQPPPGDSPARTGHRFQLDPYTPGPGTDTDSLRHHPHLFQEARDELEARRRLASGRGRLQAAPPSSAGQDAPGRETARRILEHHQHLFQDARDAVKTHCQPSSAMDASRPPRTHPAGPNVQGRARG
jgi:hypothetical protein